MSTSKSAQVAGRAIGLSLVEGHQASAGAFLDIRVARSTIANFERSVKHRGLTKHLESAVMKSIGTAFFALVNSLLVCPPRFAFPSK